MIPAGTMFNMFEKTIEKLEEELMELNRRLKTDIPAELNYAVSLGDLSENAEYHAAKEKKRLTEGRVSVIKGRIRDLTNIDLSKISKDGCGLGSIVTLEDLDTDAVITYELVVADEVDVDLGKISIAAPIGRALMGKSIDDEVKIVIPAGTKEYLITDLKTMHDRTDL